MLRLVEQNEKRADAPDNPVLLPADAFLRKGMWDRFGGRSRPGSSRMSCEAVKGFTNRYNPQDVSFIVVLVTSTPKKRDEACTSSVTVPSNKHP